MSKTLKISVAKELDQKQVQSSQPLVLMLPPLSSLPQQAALLSVALEEEPRVEQLIWPLLWGTSHQGVFTKCILQELVKDPKMQLKRLIPTRAHHLKERPGPKSRQNNLRARSLTSVDSPRRPSQ